ncbi:dienelactone hydrolase family protein [Actinoplanes sp. NPDC026619]|uniref:alpha/beta hydrolase family esterase n=1 Tax=Actinoplanes sp. NPDC026619 TaxID=3155798 RepID=UPI0033EE9E16
MNEGRDDLVLIFHGSKQTGRKHRDFTGRIFDALPATVVYLDGYRTNWNDARAASSFPARRENIDDVGFARAVIEKLRPAGRVFVIGYSNGGQMAMRLAHETPELLAGAAVIAATMPAPENFLLAAADPAPMPMLLIHGTKDPIIAYGGGELSWWARKMFKVGGRSLSMPEAAAYFAARNGIDTAPVATRVSAQVERTDYRQADHPPVALFTVHGGGHTIPGPRRAPFILGRTAQDVNTASLVSEFFGLAR